jgi:hypothetical protein
MSSLYSSVLLVVLIILQCGLPSRSAISDTLEIAGAADL